MLLISMLVRWCCLVLVLMVSLCGLLVFSGVSCVC